MHRSIRTYVLGSVLAVATVVVAGCGAAATPGTPSATPAPAPAAGRKAPHGIRGQITAENGTAWIVTTVANKQVTVTLTPQTQFGTKATPSTAQAFPVGSQVRVAGAVRGSAITANRIAAPRTAPAASAAPTA